MKLVLVSGPRAGEEIVVDGEQVIGRGEVDIVIDDPKLSRRHAGASPIAWLNRSSSRQIAD